MRSRPGFFCCCLFLAGAVAVAADQSTAASAKADSIIVMPFANLSEVERAPAEIAASFVRRLAEKGYRAAAPAEVDAFLAAERVRYLDSLSSGLRERLLTRFDASAVVFGTVYSFAEGDNAIVGVSARMLRRNGAVAWAGVSGLSSMDTEGALGARRTSSTAFLAEKAIDRLASDVPPPGAIAKLAAARARPLDLSGPVTFRSAALERGGVHRICLLPLENRSAARQASRVVTELLAQRLAASGTFAVVEPADLREAALGARVSGLRSAGPTELAKLSPAVGTSLFLRGTVYVFKDASPVNSAISPELELDLALVDAASGRIVWTSRLSRTGRDYEGLLQLGAITNIVSLADQACAEMVRTVEGANGRRMPVTATVTASDKTYDGNATATIASCALSGSLAGDATRVSCSAVSASFSDANAGTGKSVTASGISLSGEASGNYVLSSTTVTTTANVSRKTATAGVTVSDKDYDLKAAASITSCSLSGALAGDSGSVSCSAATASFSDPNAGKGKAVTASGISLSGGASGNYVLSSTTATTTASIHPKTATAGVTASHKTYDGMSAAAIASCAPSGVLAGDSGRVSCSADSAAFADARVGTGKAVRATGIRLSGSASGNYAITSTTATSAANISPKPLSASITASDKVYDGSTAAAVTSCSLAVVIASDSRDVWCRASAGAFSDKIVETGKTVTASVGLIGAAAGNYVLTSTVATAPADIRARTLTVSGVAARNKVYDGTTAASLDTSRAAFVNGVRGDDVALDAADAEGTFAAKDVGTAREVTVSGLTMSGRDRGNYTLAQPTARADITPRHITGSFTVSDKEFDGSASTIVLTRSLEGAIASDDVRLSGGTATFSDTDVGTGKTVRLSGASLSGSAAANYVLDSVATATASIASRRAPGTP